MVAVTSRRVDEPSARAPSSLDWGYRPHLDGLRAVAVYLVVAFHAGVDRMSGGFVGVDVFFVLSGYLVTQLLLRDVRTLGRVRLASFYARRFRRLLPAAFATLVATGLVFSAIASPSEMLDALDAIRAAFLYVANWFFIRQSTDYFGADINASPVVHFWSLAIEEQFYLLWPLLLTGLFFATRRAGRHQWNVMRGAVAVAALLSLFAAVRLAGTNLNRAYYGTDTRAYQLLAGALLALTPGLFVFANRHRRSLSPLAFLSFAAVLALATSLVDLGPITRGASIVLATTLLLLALDAGSGGPVKHGLSLGPITYLGRISYSTYLWHWPVIVVVSRGFDPTPVSMFAISAVLATGLASLSFQLLERPVRESKLLDRHKLPVLACGLAASVVGALVLAPAILDRERATSVVVAAGSDRSGATPVPPDLDWRGARNDKPKFPNCLGEPVQQCVLVDGTGPTVVIAGDSHARMLLPALIEIAKRDGWTLAATITPVCPWADELYYPEAVKNCRDHKADWRSRVIPELDPDIVMFEHRPFDDPLSHQNLLGVTYNEPGYLELIETESANTVERLRADGRKVVIIEPTPMPPGGMDPLTCLSDATFLDQCRYVANVGPTEVESFYRSLAERDDGVWSMDIDALVCPYFPICDPVIDGRIVKRDEGHLTATFAVTLADPMKKFFDDNNVVDH